MRTLDRLERFNAARLDRFDQAAPVLSVFTHLLALPTALAARLPEPLQAEHERIVRALAGAA